MAYIELTPSYDNVQIASSNLLPSTEELQARVRLVEEELNADKG